MAFCDMKVKGFLLLLLCLSGFQVSHGATDPQDAAALLSLMSLWTNTPPSWSKSDDPCGTNWDGVVCNDLRVTVLKLSTMGIKGTVSGDIGQLTELRSLDLSFNKELGGPLSPNFGNLKQLTTLILAGCGFTGEIPSELGNLKQLSFLALNSNKFSGKIPASLGGLSNLYWLDVADNQLSGPLPISTDKAPGLDQLLHTKHFHFNKNKLSGNIPDKLFSSRMSLIHLLFDGNQFTGKIPVSLGLVQTLEVIRLDKNYLDGPVPENINNLTLITEFNLANNKLGGPLPDLSGMSALNYVDMSNNSFDPSETPAWFSELSSLTALVIESGGIHGEVPEKLFSFPQLEQVILDNNQFNGTLTMGDPISDQLQIVNFRDNLLSSFTVTSKYNKSLILIDNPVCDTQLSNTVYCRPQQEEDSLPYSTSTTHCGKISCEIGQSLSPQSCTCAYPYQGLMVFRAPRFRDLTNTTLFQSLESSLWMKLGLTPGSVFLQNPMFNSDSYIELQVMLFPSDGMYFNRSEVLRIGFDLSNQTYKPPPMFGPYYFIASPYPFQDQGRKSSMSTGLIIAIGVGCALLFVGLVGAGIYAVLQKKRARKAIEISRPFSSWANSNKDSEGAPKLKGARWFSYDELKKSTDGFSQVNEVGSGGYGKVYRGMLSTGQLVAIKRAQHGSMQGGLEFKTEVELLSRVHHKNLVGLVGFCFEQGEQMLVYEFIPNGTLRDSLTGKSCIELNWKRRLRIALSSARGLSYLHELADPPIIHRDVKSSNILLDDNLTAKVSDFGLSRLVSDSGKGHVSTQVKGTLGYLDPEYYMSQQLTEKSDVYSFGVVMLELITARQPIEKGSYIVREVKMSMKKNEDEFYGLKKILDPLILSTINLIGLGRYLELAMRCVEESAPGRPTMGEVVKEIESILQDEGLNTNSTSASSSATDFGNTKGAFRHLYNDSFPRKAGKGGAFDYSGGFTLSAKPEPK
ncbi:probable leucine-rich repeat receptor-like protein kinase At5g49770 [Phalaenopsis equestris]|uniref:probable leucine-rich repeat receptor-like protein kinase At5g49770 n=1 Tax=Phalaenopsis equestris TaxID=78828 RepID=UPI0009E36B9F|nr:probable leucine-rich repeat receptor-like protein kinase At5g49770 [Phalaenopsis equestris]